MLNKLMTDETRAFILAFLPDAWNVAVLLGADNANQAIVTSIITKIVVFLFYIYKTGQNQGETGKTITEMKQN